MDCARAIILWFIYYDLYYNHNISIMIPNILKAFDLIFLF